MKCWGRNQEGQLGQEDMLHRGDTANELGNNLPFVNVGTGRSVVDIAVGGNITCAKLDNGTSKCWGENNYGQLGIALDHRVNQGDAVSEMGDALTAQNLGTTPTIIQMAPSNQTNCILMEENSINVIKCLGVGAEGALGIENASIGDDVSENGSNILPVDLGTDKAIAEINAGINFNCARFTDGSGKCWGNNSSAVLGSNTLSGVYVGSGAYHMGANLSYIVPGPSVSILKLAGSKGGNYTSCAILTGNILKCWGYNAQGQLGQNSATALPYIPIIPAISLGAGKTALDVSVGAYHSCTVLNDGAVKCWGRNYFNASNWGILGIGNAGTTASNNCVGVGNCIGDAAGEMTSLSSVSLGTNVTATQITSGHYHNCALTTSATNPNKIKCWGYNDVGQLGLGSTSTMGDSLAEMGDSLAYVNLGTGRTATKVAAGANHTCALLDNKKLKCWGLNSSGQLGYNSTTTVGVSSSQMGDNLPTVNVGSGMDVLDVQVGENHTCALLSNNDVKCWGINNNGQLGQGSIVNLGDNIGEMTSLQSIDID
jgi:alpha-tubulin suppressor-like RCC1 family protein